MNLAIEGDTSIPATRSPQSIIMAVWQDSSERWVACPRCRIANPAGNIRCESCGAELDPNRSSPRHPSGASTLQWTLIVGISTLLIGSAVWAGVDPNGATGRLYDAAIPFAYGAVVLIFLARAFLSFRRGNISGGITIVAVTILIALALLPSVISGTHP